MEAGAVIIGEGNTDLVRAVAMGGVRPAMMARPGSAAALSRHVSHRLPYRDPWHEPEALIEELERYGAAQSERPVLIYQGDGNALAVSRQRHRLERHYRMALPAPELVEVLNDKRRFQEFAEKHQLPVPPAVELRPSEQSPPTDLAVRLPCVLKPGSRRPDGLSAFGEGGKAMSVASLAELHDLWPVLAANDVAYLAQQMIAGPESRIESFHGYLDPAGELVAGFTGIKIRTYPEKFGHSCALETTAAPDVTQLSLDILRKIDFTGVVKLDFKRDPDGDLYLLEINTKYTLWHLLGAVAGVNLPAIVHRDLCGLGRPGPVEARPGVRWCKVWRDLSAALHNGSSWRDWLSFVARCDVKRDLQWSDPLPMVGVALMALRGIQEAPSA